MNSNEKTTPSCLALIVTTVPDSTTRDSIVGVLLQDKLVACVSSIPNVQSSYHWQGKTEQSDELLLLAKTNWELIPVVEKKLKNLHPYQTPEIMVFKADHAEKEYFRWIIQSTKSGVETNFDSEP